MKYRCPMCNGKLERTNDGYCRCKKHGLYTRDFLDVYMEGYRAGYVDCIRKFRQDKTHVYFIKKDSK